MNNKPIKLFSASAGAGKTYTLTIEYLKLALKEVENRGYFRRILAVTFTNKAAEEMKRRIIEFLYLISKNEYLKVSNFDNYEESNVLIDKILSDFKNDNIEISKNEIIQRANVTLKQILQDYGLFSVMTIDAFVQKLSQSFIEELNLPDQYEVSLDTKQLLIDLMDEVLDNLNQFPDSTLKDSIINFSMNEVDEDRSWNLLRDGLQKFLLILFEEDYYEKENLINQFEIDDFLQIEKNINDFQHNSLNELSILSKQIIDLVESQSLTINDFFQGSKGPINDFYKYVEFPQLNGNKYAFMSKVIESGNWFGSKSSNSIKDAIENIKNDLDALTLTFFNLYQEASNKNSLLQLIKKNLRKFALLKLFQKELKKYQFEHGIVSISEFSKKINHIVSNDPIPFIYEKLGEKYHHILIDEFQDTSVLQWKNFMPLLENSTAFFYTNLIVGDAKQSIYKFRGGEVGLIASLFSNDLSHIDQKIKKESLDFQRFTDINKAISIHNLEMNYRSNQSIIYFNNQLFDWIHQSSSLSTQFPLINQVYGKYVQQIPKSTRTDSTISCSFYSIHADNLYDSAKEKEWNLRKVIDIIQNSKERGFSFKDISILCRGNKDANFLAVELKNRGVPVTSSDSLLLNFSPAIRLIISYLNLRKDTKSKIIEFEFYSCVQFLLHLSFVDSLEKGKNLINELSLKSDLKQIINELINKLNLYSIQSEIPYLLKFNDLVHDFCIKKSNSVPEFVNYFEQNKDKLSINGNDQLDAITITTIHKSKGLEYPIVILGFANWPLFPTKGEQWFDFSKQENFQELEIHQKRLDFHYLPISSKSLTYFSEISSQLLDEEQATTLEALNMLYVACTRSKYDLYILSKTVSEDSPKKHFTDFDKSISKILYDFCRDNSENPIINNEDIEFIFNQNQALKINKIKENKILEKVVTADRLLEKSINLRNSRSFEEEFSDAVQKRELGNEIHELIASNNLNEIKNKIGQLKDIKGLNHKPYIENFETTLSNLEYEKYFKLDNAVLIEQDIITADGLNFRPDKVIKENNQYIVIDYKTGKKKEIHIKQIENYKNILSDLGYSPIIGKIFYLEENLVIDV